MTCRYPFFVHIEQLQSSATAYGTLTRNRMRPQWQPPSNVSIASLPFFLLTESWHRAAPQAKLEPLDVPRSTENFVPRSTGQGSTRSHRLSPHHTRRDGSARLERARHPDCDRRRLRRSRRLR